jgi:transporter family protein
MNGTIYAAISAVAAAMTAIVAKIGVAGVPSALATAIRTLMIVVLAWSIAHFRALQLAPASLVAPIDKLSLPLTIIPAAVFLGETMTWKLALGVGLMTIGAFLTLE